MKENIYSNCGEQADKKYSNCGEQAEKQYSNYGNCDMPALLECIDYGVGLIREMGGVIGSEDFYDNLEKQLRVGLDGMQLGCLSTRIRVTALMLGDAALRLRHKELQRLAEGVAQGAFWLQDAVNQSFRDHGVKRANSLVMHHLTTAIDGAADFVTAVYECVVADEQEPNGKGTKATEGTKGTKATEGTKGGKL